MLDHQSNTEIKAGTERGFGFVFCAIFLIISAMPLLDGERPWIWAASVAVVFGVLAFLAPNLLKAPNLLWFKFSLVVGAIVSELVLALVYAFTIIPMGLVMRAIRGDPLQRNFDQTAESYWIIRSDPPTPMQNQF